ncbi:MAG: hypothetical protein KUG79_13720 [Pseudomonadales bacterium]|nr:hypothetical protein [Pseudomonadales bacterium]
MQPVRYKIIRKLASLLLLAALLHGLGWAQAESMNDSPDRIVGDPVMTGSSADEENKTQVGEEIDEEIHEEIEIEGLEAALMALNTELVILEEDLLYPASSRVAVYLSLDVGELFRLDGVKLLLNGKQVAHHLYTRRQMNALYRGGVQRLYMGNARQGENELTAIFLGEGPHERDYKRAVTANFEQSFEPVYVELSIKDSAASQQPEFTASVY